MRRGFSLKKIFAAFLVAASVVTAVPAASLTANAEVKVKINEVKLVVNPEDDTTFYKATGSNIVYITPGVLNKNVLEVVVNDPDADAFINKRSINCKKALKYKISSISHNRNETKLTYRFSFYTTKERLFNFSFKVGDNSYTVKVNSQRPVKQITFGKDTLQNSNSDALGGYNCLTGLNKGKVRVKMNKNYTLTSLQLGRYKNVTEGNLTHPVIYWTDIKNGKKITLSNEKQVKSRKDDKYDYEGSMVATTIFRVNYKNNKTGVVGYVDYYLNKLVAWDN